MTTDMQDQADADLRALVSAIDPANGQVDTSSQLIARVRTSAGLDTAPSRVDEEPADPDGVEPRHAASPGSAPREVRRHWQAALLAAATLASLALASWMLLAGLGASGGDTVATAPGSGSTASQESASMPDAGTAQEGAAPDGSGSAAADKAGVPRTAEPAQGSAGSGTSRADRTDPGLVRSASLLVGTEDPQGARDAFAATVERLGGRITFESITQAGSALAGDVAVSSEMSSQQMATWPWYPTGPGIWLAAQVPAERFDEAVRAARAAGIVVQMQQSSYDVSDQITDVRARIAALESSLARLDALMGDAKGISEVIAVEQAIAQRQSELDALRAQQRDLADQTQMSRISLALMSPDDAQAAVDPGEGDSWWDSLLAGLARAWAWLGQALLVVSPLLIAIAVVLWARRRSQRGATPSPEPGTGD